MPDVSQHDEPGAGPLALIGGGNMGAALLGGMLAAPDVDRAEIVVVEVRATRRAELEHIHPGLEVVAEVPRCAAAVLAVKPDDVASVAQTAVDAGATRLLSIAAGVSTEAIESAVGRPVAVVRAMPNTPALVGVAASAITGGSHAAEADLAWAESILSAVGTVDRLPEPLLDAFTGVAGSGPAYVFLVAEALIDAAVAQGMPHPVARRVVARTLLGASTLLERHGDPADLRAKVTSPGGTTAAAIAALERRAVRSAFGEAVAAATARSRELG